MRGKDWSARVSALAVTLAAAGCGSAAGDGAAEVIVACGLLTADEAVGVIGDNDGGKALYGDTSTCQWENPRTHHAVSIGVGSPGEASGDTLPPPGEGIVSEAGPDGIRWVGTGGGGLAEFASAGRVFSVQVYSDREPAAARAAEVAVIGLIRPRIPR